MSEIRINIIDNAQTISGTMHGSFGDILIASLTAEPETVEELEMAAERFIKRESDWSFFRGFRRGEDFEFDRFEFSFIKDRAEWEAEQRLMEEFNREFNEKYCRGDDDFFERNEEIF